MTSFEQRIAEIKYAAQADYNNATDSGNNYHIVCAICEVAIQIQNLVDAINATPLESIVRPLEVIATVQERKP